MDRNEIEAYWIRLPNLICPSRRGRRFVRTSPVAPTVCSPSGAEGARHAITKIRLPLRLMTSLAVPKSASELDHSLSTAFDEATITQIAELRRCSICLRLGKARFRRILFAASIREAFRSSPGGLAISTTSIRNLRPERGTGNSAPKDNASASLSL